MSLPGLGRSPAASGTTKPRPRRERCRRCKRAATRGLGNTRASPTGRGSEYLHRRGKRSRISARPPGHQRLDPPTPETCGIVETDAEGIVNAFHEKSNNPPGNQANGAVYFLEPEVLKWIDNNPEVSDFSTEVLPHFMGSIATWSNHGIHRDIGALPMLKMAQFDPQPTSCWPETDAWQKKFLRNPIHLQVAQAAD